MGRAHGKGGPRRPREGLAGLLEEEANVDFGPGCLCPPPTLLGA